MVQDSDLLYVARAVYNDSATLSTPYYFIGAKKVGRWPRVSLSVMLSLVATNLFVEGRGSCTALVAQGLLISCQVPSYEASSTDCDEDLPPGQHQSADIVIATVGPVPDFASPPYNYNTQAAPLDDPSPSMPAVPPPIGVETPRSVASPTSSSCALALQEDTRNPSSFWRPAGSKRALRNSHISQASTKTRHAYLTHYFMYSTGACSLKLCLLWLTGAETGFLGFHLLCNSGPFHF